MAQLWLDRGVPLMRMMMTFHPRNLGAVVDNVVFDVTRSERRRNGSRPVVREFSVRASVVRENPIQPEIVRLSRAR
jgi:hypothetical protein